jgi:hypothetical protein
MDFGAALNQMDADMRRKATLGESKKFLIAGGVILVCLTGIAWKIPGPAKPPAGA